MRGRPFFGAAFAAGGTTMALFDWLFGDDSDTTTTVNT